MEENNPEIDTGLVLIAPLVAKAQLKGAFSKPEDEPEFENLLKFITTAAWLAQKEHKSKTYLILYGDEVLGYLTVSSVKVEFEIPDESNEAKGGEPQGVLMGKLYIKPRYRQGGVGALAVQFTIDIGLKMNDLTGCVGVIVHAHESATDFYSRMGFVDIETDDNERTMFFKF